jgi:hypothetical protein
MKRHIHALLITPVILLTLFFILGETSWRTTLTETISSIPVVTQRAAVSDFNSSLVAYYTFDDTTNDSAGSNNGTVSGGPTYTTGKVNRALVLDGVDDVVSTPAGISGSDFSYSFWMKNTGLTSGTPIAFGSYKFCGRDGTNLRCTVDGDSSGAATAGNVYDGNWHHIVFVNSGNTQKIYKDGVLAGSATETVNTSGAQVRIGNRISSSSFLAATIDEMFIYNKALSLDEVGQLYGFTGGLVVDNTGTPTQPNTPTGQGTVVTDPVIVPTTPTPNPVVEQQAKNLIAPTNLMDTEDYAGSKGEADPTGSFDMYYSWEYNGSGQEGFVLEASRDAFNTVSGVTTLASPSARTALVHMNASTEYWYRVRAYITNNGQKEYSPSSNVMHFWSIQKPLYFTVYTQDPTQATIEWHPRSTVETGYKIERSSDGGKNFSVIVARPSGDFLTNTNHGGDLLYTDYNLSQGVTYIYRVYGYIVGSSPEKFSPYAFPPQQAIAPSLAPAAPTISARTSVVSANGDKNNPTTVRVSITDNSNNETKFNVERSTDQVNWTYLGFISWSAGEKVFSDRAGLLLGTRYYYRVTAVNNTAQSAYAYLTVPVSIPNAPPTGVTAWYVWRGATGTLSGESWANAWGDVDQINWSAIKPGDTLYISGDDYGKGFSISSSGVQGNPIKIRPGSAAPNPTGHDGRVIVSSINFNGSNWVTLDGSKDASFVPNSALDIKQNINMEVRNAPSHGIYNGTSATGISVRFVEVNTVNGIGIYFNGNPLEKIDIYGVYVHHTTSVGINFNGTGSEGYASIKLQKSLIEYTADDLVQIAGTGTIKGNIMRYNNDVGAGHADGIQTVSANYVDISENIIANRSKSSYVVVLRSATSGTYGHWRVVNNLFYYSNPADSVITEGVFLSAMSLFEPCTSDPTKKCAGQYIPSVHWDDITIANNTFVNLDKMTVINVGRRPAEVGQVTISNFTIKNNIIYNSGGDGAPVGLSGASGGFVYAMNSFAVHNNIVYGSGSKSISYNGLEYTPEQVNSVAGFSGNSSAEPKFVNLAGSDFHLSSIDTAAINKGLNLSNLGFATDFDGAARGAGGAWDIGAYEYTGQTPSMADDVAAGLVGNWNFDNDTFSLAKNDTYRTIDFADMSGKGNAANCQSAFALNGTTYNQCPAVGSGPDGSRAAEFSGLTMCDNSADYLAIPKTSDISSMTRGSVALWVSNRSNGNDGLNYRVLDGLRTGLRNTWQFRRDGDLFYTLTLNSDTGAETDILKFPGNASVAGSWNHYAFTWDGVTIKGYYNGSYFGQASMVGFSSFDISNYLAIGTLMHGEPRNTNDSGNCVRQYGAPAGMYAFPNAGFFGGKVDDIRIYNRPLTGSEVASLARKTLTPSNQFMLIQSKMGDGIGGCGTRCAEAYNPGTVVTLTPNPGKNTTFIGWGGDCSGTGTCRITMNGPKNVTATYKRTTHVVASFEAENGSLTNGTVPSWAFISKGGSIYQPIQVTTVEQGGRASYDFNLEKAGDYYVVAKINAPSGAANSVFLNIDSEPTSPTMIWDPKPQKGEVVAKMLRLTLLNSLA